MPGGRRELPAHSPRRWRHRGPAARADLRRIGPREVIHPVDLPGLAIERERLLPVRVIGSALDPQKAHLDRLAVVLVLAVELAAVALEAADHGREHLAG